MDENAEDLPERPPTEVPQVATGSRRRLLWLIVAAVVVFGAGAATATLLLRGDDEDIATRPWVPPAAESPITEYVDEAAIQKHCLDPGGKQTVVAYFDGDDPDPAMRQAADALGEDDRIAWVKTETRQEAYEHFKVLFAEQPEMVELVRPQSLPASVTLLPAEGVYPGDLANAITDEFPEIESVNSGCEFPE